MTRAHGTSRKASFSELYDQPDPRLYYRMLADLDYQTPAHGQRAVGRLLAAATAGREPPVIADLCCSYGIMSALLTCDITWDALSAHYRNPALDDLTPEQLATADQAWYADRRHADAPRVVGVDVATRAVAYGERVGLHRPGFAENLETGGPSEALAAALRPVRLVTVSGGVSYITERTLEHVLSCCDEPPWLAAFVLRSYDYAAITAAGRRHGLVTERLEGRTFRQRRFVDDRERDATLERLAELGKDPAPEAADGYHHTELFVSRPAASASARPLAAVLAARG